MRDATSASAPPARKSPSWREVPDSARPAGPPKRTATSGIIVRAAILGALALFALLQGNTSRALGLFGFGVVLTLVALVVPAFGPLLDRAALRLGHWASALVTTFGAVLVELFIGLPGRLFSKLRRGDAITGVRRDATTSWRDRDDTSDEPPTRPYAVDIPRASRRSRARWRPITVLGVFAIFVAIDLLIGSFLNRAFLPDTLRTERIATPIERGLPLPAPTSPSAAAHLVALRSSPWAAGCYRELNQVSYLFAPFLMVQPQDRTGRCVNIVDHHRVSYEPSGSATRPVVWFFGGSAVFGDGQRDAHTIASEYARSAEAAGHPVRVENYGRPGFTAWQEALLLEQLLAHHAPPDAIVFYDGANDVFLHERFPIAQPTAFPTDVAVSAHRGGTKSLYERWADHSAVRRVWSWLAGNSASASDVPPSTATIAHQTVAVYARSMGLAQELADMHHTPIHFAFQPARMYAELPSAPLVRAQLPHGVLDLSTALDHTPSDVWIDGVHVNETGAATIARQLYAALNPTTGGH